MTERKPEDVEPIEPTELPREVGQHIEESSIRGSAQRIGIEPDEDFIPPTMALDAYEPEAE